MNWFPRRAMSTACTLEVTVSASPTVGVVPATMPSKPDSRLMLDR